MGEELQPVAKALDKVLERVITIGDLAQLSPAERNAYYIRVCESLGLNPYTRPFEYLLLKDRDRGSKLVLYARKDCADQLRKINNVSITLNPVRDGDVFRVTAVARLPNGREDADIGSVYVKGLSGDYLCNAEMKAVTKSKRRVTLSVCGLGFLDETEIDSIDGATLGEPQDEAQKAQLQGLVEMLRKCGVTDAELRDTMIAEVNVPRRQDLTKDQAAKVIGAFTEWLSEKQQDQAEKDPAL